MDNLNVSNNFVYFSSKESAVEYSKNAKKPFLIMFYTEWCPDCQEMKIIFENIANLYDKQCIFAKVTVDEHPEIGKAFEIRAVPTLFFIFNNFLVDKIVGYLTELELKNAINNFLNIIYPPQNNDFSYSRYSKSLV